MKSLYISLLAAVALGTFSMAAEDEVIKVAPQGRVVKYSYAGTVVSNPNYELQVYQDAGGVGEGVFCDNGDVYLKNVVIPFVYSDSYIKGHIEKDEIVFTFPQLIHKEFWDMGNGNTGYDYSYLNICKRTGTGAMLDYTIVDNPAQNTIRLKLDGDVIKWQSVDDGSYMIAVTSQNDWKWNGIYNFVATPFDGEFVEAPENLVTEEYEMIFSGQYRKIQVGFDNNDIYMKNLSQYAPNAWVKGTIEGDKAIFKANQYMGINDEFRHYAYFMPASPVQVEINGKKDLMLEIADEIAFNYNAETKGMQSSYVFVINTNKEFIRYYQAFEDPIIRKPKTQVDSYVPANPTIISYYDLDPLYGQFSDDGSITFTVPYLSIADDILNTKNLYYRIYIDGDPWEFYADEYQGIRYEYNMDSLIDIPYDFDDTQDFIANGTYHMVYLHNLHGIESIGVQSIYLLNGEQYESEVIYYDDSKVEAVESEAGVVAETYYDINGLRVNNPENGLFIRRAVLSDGSIKTSKVVIKNNRKF